MDFYFHVAKSHCLAADMLAARSLLDQARSRYQMCEQINREIVTLKPNYDAARKKLDEVENLSQRCHPPLARRRSRVSRAPGRI